MGGGRGGAMQKVSVLMEGRKEIRTRDFPIFVAPPPPVINYQSIKVRLRWFGAGLVKL